ncbi:MAG: alcohol dehydrogenase catalytic domain-containing protein [bacterium]|nr:alcohol dehydrogenase catalytic domain-containing protein [bacterium]MDT8396809.1 alcohol dehydrogenase catalytic domain-containing protein [bacterium]
MRAAVLNNTADLSVVDLPDPVPGSGEVLIAVTLAGICGTDYSLYKGKFDVPLPVIPGHEGIGIVKEVGPNVSKVTAGQRVVIQPNFSCWDCELCNSGMDNICSEKIRLGIDANGMFAQYVKVPSRYVWTVPESLDDQTAVLTEPLAVAAHGVKILPPADGDRVMIIGGGVIGLMTLLLAKLAGAEVGVSDLLGEHLSLASEMGADSTFLVGGEKEPEPSSFDLIYETSGAAVGLADAIGLAAPGGRIALLGLPGPDHPVSTTQIVRKELSINGSMIYTDEFPGVLELLESRQIDPTPLISDVIGLEELDSAIKNFHAPDRLKVLVTP